VSCTEGRTGDNDDYDGKEIRRKVSERSRVMTNNVKRMITLAFVAVYFVISNVRAHSRICTHCCDEVYPGNGTPAYFLLKGEKGDQGNVGPPGPQGIQGIKGDTGVKGPTGSVGPRGDKGDQGKPAPASPKSAFSVARLSPMIGNETKAAPVTFDKEFVNEGRNFDLKSGRFIVKHPGVYFFTYTVQSYLDKFLGIQLMRNNNPQVILYANSVPRRIMQSQSLMLKLDSSEVIWLRQAKGARFAIYGNQDVQITFNGFLLYADL